MKRTMEELQQRLHELTKDLARVQKIVDENPDALITLRPTLQALGKAIGEVHAKISENIPM